jgi:hypothetical protein
MNKCFAFCDNSKNNQVISNHFLKPKTLTQDVQPKLVSQKNTLSQTLKDGIILTPDNQAQPLSETLPFELEQYTTFIEPVTEHLFEDICPGIDGYGFVLMANQEYKQIYKLNKGDMVMSFDQNNIMIPSKIKYIVKTKINNLIMMSYMNDIAISSNHKIQLNNSDWFYPKDFLNTHKSKIDYLYNIVLDNGCGIIVNNLKVITLGYLNTYDRGISYYATQAFVNDMSKYDINNDGYIVLEKPYILENNNSQIKMFMI